MIKKIPIFWIVVFSLLLTSAVPLGAMAYSAITTTQTNVESTQKAQLQARVLAYSDTIDLKFRWFQDQTSLASAQAKQLLNTPLSQDEIDQRLQNLELDPTESDVYGLDKWYRENGKTPQIGDPIADPYVSKTSYDANTAKIRHDIATAQGLTPLFAAIKNSNNGTQWVYLSTPEGMMVLYPWDGNTTYGAGWEPQAQDTFYTLVTPAQDPERTGKWSAPYNDSAGAGIMVTNSIPIYDGDKFMGVMSHDFLINDIQNQVLNFKFGEQGFAFLVDTNGDIIAHPQFQESVKNVKPGDNLTIKLADQDHNMAVPLMTMLQNSQGLSGYKSANGDDWVLSFATIPSTGWHLGVMQPNSEIIAPAIAITRQVTIGAVALIFLVLVISLLLARAISRPLSKLAHSATEIEHSVDEEYIDPSSILSSLKDVSLMGAKEISALVDVFGQMVVALQSRMAELRSIYAMGQTITANVDFDKTLQAVLSAVHQVCDFDAAEVSLLEDDRLVVEAWQGKENFTNMTGRKYRVGQGLTGTIASTKAVNFMPHIEQLDLKSTLGWAAQGEQSELLGKSAKLVINSFLGLPLQIGDKLIGTLALIHHTADYFTEDNKRQLLKLAPQASIAIQNAIAVRQRESTLQRQIKELQIEIDHVKQSKQVKEIVETEFFQELQSKARAMRTRHSSGIAPAPEIPTESTPAAPEVHTSEPLPTSGETPTTT